MVNKVDFSMMAAKTRYEPTPMLGWRNGDIYPLTTYHVYPLQGLSNLTSVEAAMVAEFMNRLRDDRSIRAIESRVRLSNLEGINRLLYVRYHRSTLMAERRDIDYLQLRIKQGAIVWDRNSILEGYENGYSL